MIGWSDTKIIDDKIYVLAETNEGHNIALFGEVPDEIKPSVGWERYPYEPPEEFILKHGQPLDFESAKQIFGQIKKSNYVQTDEEATSDVK